MNYPLIDNCAAINVAHKHAGRWYKQSPITLGLQHLTGKRVSLVLLDHSAVLDPLQTWSLRDYRGRQKFECVILACKGACIAGKWNDVQFLGMWLRNKKKACVCRHNVSCCRLSHCVQHKQAMTSSWCLWKKKKRIKYSSRFTASWTGGA